MAKDRGFNGRFRGYRKNCEFVPSLPARIVTRYLSDPRKLPYLLMWIDPDSGEIREVVRLSFASWSADSIGRPEWIEVKRSNEDRTCIGIVEQTLPMGGKAVLLVCRNCQKPRRSLFAWNANKAAKMARPGPWRCRRCSELSYASEGGALIYRTRWSVTRPLSGLNLWLRPEVWEPLVFTSPLQAFELGFIQTVNFVRLPSAL
jgi:hypothetical protein